MKFIFILLLSIILLFPAFNFSFASCADPTLPNDDDSSAEICNPINTSSPQQLIGKVIQAVLGISGSLALLMFVYGGFVWMMSGGNSEKVTKGKNTLVWASIGLVVIFSSYAMVKFIFTGLGA